MWNFNCVFFVIFIASINCWRLPELLANKRVQYYLAQNDGGYKYGFDTGNGYFGKQIADSNNEVFGHYAYPVGGNLVDVRYTSGVNGFIPEGYPVLKVEDDNQPQWDSTATDSTGDQIQIQGEYSYTDETGKHDLIQEPNVIPLEPENSDGSYSFQYDTGDHTRQESSDSSGNVMGSFSYQNEAGHHDLTYVAGADTGFVVTGGSLAQPAPEESGADVGVDSLAPSAPDASSSWSILNPPAIETHGPEGTQGDTLANSAQSGNSDGSYSFQYDTGDHSRQESSDSLGNVQGSFSYNNEAGHHDLTYVAGADTGFVVTGGSLAPPAPEGASSWSTLNTPAISTSTWVSHENSGPSTSKVSSSENHINPDGSYSFEYDAGNHFRKESGNKDGHVQGKYGYHDEAGYHDLSYKAGDPYGFVVLHYWEKSTPAPVEVQSNVIASDSVTIAGESETSSQINQDEVTEATTISGGSELNIVVEDTTVEEEVTTVEKSDHHHDKSYSFEYDTGNHYRKESADKDGHVKGLYGYKDEAGHHDLSYKAGDDYGFIVTGGNLAEPNIHKKAHSHPESDTPTTWPSGVEINTITADSITVPAESATSWDVNQGVSHEITTESSDTQWSTNVADSNVEDDYQEITESSKDLKDHDGSYSFEYDTGKHYRKESADKDGHVQGTYGYKDEAGNHDLSYKAGDDYGFIVTGGSLAEPNGLNGKSIPETSQKTDESSVQNDGDGSYSFEYNAGDHSRKESSDASGHVVGSFSYQNEAGQHDLSYISGPETGFVVTGGNLAEQNPDTNSVTDVPSETVGTSAPNNGYLPPFTNPILSSSYTLGDVHVKQYFPSAENTKFGYVFESKH